MKLEECRRKIDAIDAEIVRLLNERAQVAEEVGQLKIKAGLPILDEERENRILRNVGRQSEDLSRSQSLIEIYRLILRESRRIQFEIVEKTTKNILEIYR